MNKKMDSLQVIRALAFLGIFASHSGIGIFAAHGAWGVSVFFILSGFLMFYSYSDTNRITESGVKYSIKFGVNKIKRLYPLHVVTLISALPFLIKSYIGYEGIKGFINPTVKIGLNAALIQTWFPSSGIYFSLNAVSWYLSVSLFLYCMFPLILMFMQKKYKGVKNAITVISFLFIFQIVLSYISYLVQINVIHNDDFIHWFAYIFPLSRLEDFIIGCNLGYLFRNCKRDKDISTKKATFFEMMIGLVLLVEWTIYVLKVSIPQDNNNWWGLTVMYTLSSCALIYLFALNKGKISCILTNKVFVFVGNMSANGFLIHQMVYRYLDTIERQMIGDSNKYVNIFICFALTIICSLIWDKIYHEIGNRIPKKKSNLN